jgi:hypothetical protein
MVVSLSVFFTAPPQGRVLVLTDVTGCVNPTAKVRLEGMGKLKEYDDLIGNLTRESPTSRIVYRRPLLALSYPMLLLF